MKLVRIEWLDAEASNSWTNKDEPKIGGIACETVAFLVGESEQWVRIAHTDGGEAVHGVMDIPRGCIVNLRELLFP